MAKFLLSPTMSHADFGALCENLVLLLVVALRKRIFKLFQRGHMMRLLLSLNGLCGYPRLVASSDKLTVS